jgi:hypothetical protein
MDRHLVVLCMLMGLPRPALEAAEPDGFLGTWTVDRDASHYATDPVPETMSVAIEAVGSGVHYRSTAHWAGGRTRTADFTAHFDGVPVLVVGSWGLLAPVSLRRVDSHTIRAIYTVGLQESGWAEWTVDAAGSRLTMKSTYTGDGGERRTNIAVFTHAQDSTSGMIAERRQEGDRQP